VEKYQDKIETVIEGAKFVAKYFSVVLTLAALYYAAVVFVPLNGESAHNFHILEILIVLIPAFARWEGHR
jgi:hypothetical protein